MDPISIAAFSDELEKIAIRLPGAGAIKQGLKKTFSPNLQTQARRFPDSKKIGVMIRDRPKPVPTLAGRIASGPVGRTYVKHAPLLHQVADLAT